MKFYLPLLFLFVFFMIEGCAFEGKVSDGDELTKEELDSVPPAFEETIPTKLEFDSSKFEISEGHFIVDWQFLSRVIFEDGYINDTLAMVPVFHDEIKVLDRKPIQIRGYNIPFGDDSGKLHILSAYPNSQCFFCGGAGPESVMDIKTKKIHKKLKTDAMLTFRGVLELNDDNLDYLNYILNDAVLMESD